MALTQPRSAPATSREWSAAGTGQLRAEMRRQTWTMAAVVVAVVYLDQLSKAWAWRHLSAVSVNSGGDLLVSPAVSDLFRDRAAGALFDVVDAALLVGALLLLGRRQRAPGVLVFGSLLLAGWLSNLTDRLGMHYWTAPGSVRGAVDFLPFAGYSWNLADVAIIAGTAGLVPALALAGVRLVLAPPDRPRVRIVRRPWRHPGVRVAMALGVTAVLLLAVIGACVGGYGDSPGTVFAARGY